MPTPSAPDKSWGTAASTHRNDLPAHPHGLVTGVAEEVPVNGKGFAMILISPASIIPLQDREVQTSISSSHRPPQTQEERRESKLSSQVCLVTYSPESRTQLRGSRMCEPPGLLTEAETEHRIQTPRITKAWLLGQPVAIDLGAMGSTWGVV